VPRSRASRQPRRPHARRLAGLQRRDAAARAGVPGAAAHPHRRASSRGGGGRLSEAPVGDTFAFYARAMKTLHDAEIPFLVGGAYAFARYTGIERHTKDFDIFVRPSDVDEVFTVLAGAGCETEITFPHWLGKAKCGADLVDIIFSSGNGVATVDEAWFEHAV